MNDGRRKLTIKSKENEPVRPEKPVRKKNNKLIWGITTLILLAAGVVSYFVFTVPHNEAHLDNKRHQSKKTLASVDTFESDGPIESTESQLQTYHFKLDNFVTETKLLDEENTVAQLLDSTQIHSTIKQEIIDAIGADRVFKEGTKFLTLAEKTYPDIPVMLILEETYDNYMVISLKDDDIIIKDYPRKLKKQIKTGKIEITGDVLADISKMTHPDLVGKIESVIAWKTDINRLEPGDILKVAYEELTYNNQPLGVGSLLALQWISSGNSFGAVILPNKKDEKGNDLFCTFDGKPLKEPFRKSPVNYGRVSSRFNLFRKHPVLQKVMPHYGTDFAAPEGAPLLTVGDGVVIEQRYTSNNGNYIKIKHDDTYTTQYLHLSRFKSNLNVGSRVRQGDVIGYVGHTGRATGPHVCLRLWKNGKQVNFLKEKFPVSGAIKSYDASLFIENRDYYISLLAEKN